MTALRLKLVGLNGIDRNSLRSMLRLSTELLSSEWILIEEGQADLEIYAFDTEAGQRAWQNRKSGMTALLTNMGNVTEPVDIVLRKPLRKSSFAEALNLVDEKLSQQRTPDKKSALQTSQNGNNQQGQLGKLLSCLHLRRKPAAHLPPLDFHIPAASPLATDTIKDPILLKTWINQLPKDANQRAITLLKNIEPLCQLRLRTQTLLRLLEVYRDEVQGLLFTRDISAVKRDLYVTTENLRAIRCVSDLIAKLGMGYQQLARQLYERGATPDSNSTLLFCLNRSTEQLSLLLLHAFQYYRKPPANTWRWLNQQYRYQEQAGTLKQKVSLKDPYHSRSFHDLYVQITLTALSDPYSLDRFDVIRLFQLMSAFTDKIETGLLSQRLINTTSNFLLTGHFCIDTDSDQMPQPAFKTPKTVRQRPSTRLLNTQPVLLDIENLFKDARSRRHVSLDMELQLLKKIIPQLNTTHERRYHRLNSAKHRMVHIAHGISAVHQSLSDELTNAIVWQLANQSSGGMMANRQSEDCYHLNIGDFVGIFEQNFTVKLASIRWLFIDTEGETVIGLELIDGKPVPVFCTPDGEAEQHPALILPSVDPHKPAALITEKGLYSPGRHFRIKGDSEPYLIEASGMIDCTLDYELFNFSLRHGS